MAKIEGERTFVAVNIAILTVSDSRTAKDDTSGTAARRPPDRGRPPSRREGHRRRRPGRHRRPAQGVDRRSRDRRGHRHRRHRRHRPRRHAGGLPGGLREGDPGLRRAVPLDQLRQDQDLHHPVAGDGRRRRRHLSLRAARLARRLQGRLGRDPGPPARRALQAVQLRRTDAAPQGALGLRAYPLRQRARAAPSSMSSRVSNKATFRPSSRLARVSARAYSVDQRTPLNRENRRRRRPRPTSQ